MRDLCLRRFLHSKKQISGVAIEGTENYGLSEEMLTRATELTITSNKVEGIKVSIH